MLERNSQKRQRMLIWRVPKIADRFGYRFPALKHPMRQFTLEKRRGWLKRKFYVLVLTVSV